jgi:hypothetical protein
LHLIVPLALKISAKVLHKSETLIFSHSEGAPTSGAPMAIAPKLQMRIRKIAPLQASTRLLHGAI